MRQLIQPVQGRGGEDSLERLTAQKMVGVSQEKWEWAILAIRNIVYEKETLR